MQAINHHDELPGLDKPIDADSILTDDALERGGLVKVEAFMRTRTSAAAARKAKQREQQADSGIKQANILGTPEVLEPIKAIAKACAIGESIETAILREIPSVTSSSFHQ